jgi:hypothetical protein
MKHHHRLPLLPPGTTVQRLVRGQLGTVQRYSMEHSIGTFPVRWHDTGGGAIWETCGFDDVRVIQHPGTQLVTA